jgi:excisionase family DNA binding protein
MRRNSAAGGPEKAKPKITNGESVVRPTPPPVHSESEFRMNTNDSTTQSNVIEAAHRFRPALFKPDLVQVDLLIDPVARAAESAWRDAYEPWQASRDALCRRVAPELFELSPSALFAHLTPAQRAIVAQKPWLDVRNIVCWNMINFGQRQQCAADGDAILTTREVAASLQIGRREAANLCATGVIKGAFRIGRSWRIRANDLRKFIDGCGAA